MTATPSTDDADRVLKDLSWEQLANDLEDWLDAGHRPPRCRPASMLAPPALRRCTWNADW